jgi:hypothetical protein
MTKRADGKRPDTICHLSTAEGVSPAWMRWQKGDRDQQQLAMSAYNPKVRLWLTNDLWGGNGYPMCPRTRKFTSYCVDWWVRAAYCSHAHLDLTRTHCTMSTFRTLNPTVQLPNEQYIKIWCQCMVKLVWSVHRVNLCAFRHCGLVLAILLWCSVKGRETYRHCDHITMTSGRSATSNWYIGFKVAFQWIKNYQNAGDFERQLCSGDTHVYTFYCAPPLIGDAGTYRNCWSLQ